MAEARDELQGGKDRVGLALPEGFGADATAEGLRPIGIEPPEDAPAAGDLPGGSPEAAYDRFLSEHAPTWMPRFAESRRPFYRDAAAFLAALVG